MKFNRYTVGLTLAFLALVVCLAVNGCSAEQQATVKTVINPDPDGDGVGALDKLVTTPVTQLPQAAETYVIEVATGLATFTIAGLIGLFTPKPGTKKKQLAEAELAFDQGKVAGTKLGKVLANIDNAKKEAPLES